MFKLSSKNLKKLFFLSSLILFGIFASQNVQAATSYFSPSSGNFTVGNIFTVNVLINTEGVAINNAEATINFPSDFLEIVSISKSGSIFSLWVEEPTFSNSAGTLSFSGGLPTPGFSGTAGKALGAVFRVKKTGSASLVFSSAAVRANDGYGTNVFRTGTQALFNLISPTAAPPAATPAPAAAIPGTLTINSETHPDSSKWYNSSLASFNWTPTLDITGVSLLFDKKPDSNPGNVPDGLFEKKTYENIEEGVWYFHLKAKNTKGWGPVNHYKIQTDLTPPLPFEIKIQDGKETTNPQPTLLFETKDEVSGLSHYKIRIGEGDKFIFQQTEHNPFKMPLQAPGSHPIKIWAVDNANNSQEASTEVIIKGVLIVTPPPPGLQLGSLIISYGIIILILLLILALIIILFIIIWYKIKLKVVRLRKEIKEAETSVHNSFDVLRDEIRERLESMEKISRYRALTKEEDALREELIRDLNTIEKYVKKQIRDVGRMLE